MYQPKDDDLTKTTCDKRGAEGQPRRGDCNQGEGCRTRVPPDLRATPGTSLTYTNMFVERVGHDTAGDDHRPLQLSDTLMSLSERQKNSTFGAQRGASACQGQGQVQSFEERMDRLNRSILEIKYGRGKVSSVSGSGNGVLSTQGRDIPASTLKLDESRLESDVINFLSSLHMNNKSTVGSSEIGQQLACGAAVGRGVRVLCYDLEKRCS